MPDIGLTDTITPGASDQALYRRGSDGEVVRVDPGDIVAGAPWAGAAVADAVLKAFVWESVRSLVVATWDESEEPRLPSTGTVTWPFDAAAGSYTTVDVDPDWRVVTEFTVTHTPSSKTVTVVLSVLSGGELSISSITVA